MILPVQPMVQILGVNSISLFFDRGGYASGELRVVVLG
jgi:hypothetical protein